MLVHFTTDQFSMLKTAFSISDPRDTFAPDEMPVPVESVTELSTMLDTATDNSLCLTPDLAHVLKACFCVGAEDNADFDDESYWAILGLLNRLTTH